LINLSTILVSTKTERTELNPTFKFMSLADQIYDHLFQAIISGKLKPGEKLVENELCKEFGISRAPIRESFRVLESEGLIVIQPRKGTHVKALTREDIEEAFAVRESLESLAAKLAVPHMTETEMNALANLIKEMDNAIKKRDSESFRRANVSFHEVFIRASRNRILLNILEMLGKGIWMRISSMYYQSTEGFTLSNAKHKEIWKAYKNEDEVRIKKLVEEHIKHARDRLLRFYDQASGAK
jgi:DNA-binding GntR family transcriptional regulator